MTPKEKRAFEAMEEILIGGPTERELAVVMKMLDAAERRGEERVLRWMRARGWDGAIVDYKQARRARVGRGRK